MTRQGRRRIKQCAYCGELKPSTRDHVVPRCLFPRPLPMNMITVPACEECNGRKARHDDFLRDLLVTDVAGSQSPIAQKIFADKTIRSHEQGRSLLGRIAMGNMTEIPILDSEGNADTAFLGTFDSVRATEMFSFLIQGLYFSTRTRVLPSDSQFKIGRLLPDDLEAWLSVIQEYGIRGPYQIGEGVFSFIYNYSNQTETVSFWLLEFYDRVHYSVITFPAGFHVGPRAA